MKTTLIVAQKELVDFLRDRRTLAIAFLSGPVLYPVILAVGLSLISEKLETRFERPLTVLVEGAARAPNLVAWLKSQGVDARTEAAPGDPLPSDRIILRVGPDFEDAWRSSRAARVEIDYDSSSAASDGASDRLGRLLSAYSSQVTRLRLLIRGVAPTVLEPLEIDYRDTAPAGGSSTEREKVAAIAVYVTFALSLLAGSFFAIYLAVDSTAGERERQALEPLLYCAVSPTSVMSGKLLAVAGCTLVMVFLMLPGFAVVTHVFQPAPLREGLASALGASAVATMAVLATPLIGLVTCLMTGVAAFSKTYKEALNYASLALLLAAGAVSTAALKDGRGEWWALLLPGVGQIDLLGMMVHEESIGAWRWLAWGAASLGWLALAWAVTARLYRRERLVVGS